MPTKKLKIHLGRKLKDSFDIEERNWTKFSLSLHFVKLANISFKAETIE